ncbi:MAG: nucleotidyltransferase domain-containing protein [Leptolyngbyaceae cyanobacterium SM2_5_2]|nr:nucleotidyltransferase domain-containing protein [Leptolyngbyaceae cyanobacterium SM2_5_2]
MAFSHAIDATKMQSYVDTARRRQQKHQENLRQRQQQGLKLAHLAAQILRGEFEVHRVVLFGSVLSEDTFHETSDLDLAVWGLPPSDYIKAVARLMELPEFSIDLVEAEMASTYLREAIAQGLDL